MFLRSITRILASVNPNPLVRILKIIKYTLSDNLNRVSQIPWVDCFDEQCVPSIEIVQHYRVFHPEPHSARSANIVFSVYQNLKLKLLISHLYLKKPLHTYKTLK